MQEEDAHLLIVDEGAELVVDCVVSLGHGATLTPTRAYSRSTYRTETVLYIKP